MEEIKVLAPTVHGIRALCTRGDEAVKDGELINRFRAGHNYKEWSWLGYDKPEFFFFKLQGNFSPLFESYSEIDSHARKLLYTPQDAIEIYRGTHEAPVLKTTLRFSPQDLLARGYSICSNCHGSGNNTSIEPCIFCSGSGWYKKETV